MRGVLGVLGDGLLMRIETGRLGEGVLHCLCGVDVLPLVTDVEK